MANLNRVLLIGNLTRDHANKIGQPLLIEILNVAGPRQSKELSVYNWTLAMLHLFSNLTASGAGFTETAGE